MKTIEEYQKVIKSIHKTGTQETKEQIEKEFPDLFKTNELEKAIKKLGEKDKEVIKLRKLEQIEDIESNLAYQKLVVIIKYLNDGWVRQKEEDFYYPWFYTNPFRFCGVYWSDSFAFVPASLCFVGKNAEENANYASKNEEILKYYEICF